MFKAIKEFFVGKPKPVTEEAPYKVEATPFIAAGEPPATVVTPAPVAEVPTLTEVVETKPAAMKAKKKPANKKPAGEKKPAPKKGGRKPKAKKEAV